MEIVEVTSREYQSGMAHPYHVFASAAFNESKRRINVNRFTIYYLKIKK